MNRFKNMVHAGEQPVGTFVGSASMLMTEACAAAGFDYVIIDTMFRQSPSFMTMRITAQYGRSGIARWNR